MAPTAIKNSDVPTVIRADYHLSRATLRSTWACVRTTGRPSIANQTTPVTAPARRAAGGDVRIVVLAHFGLLRSSVSSSVPTAWVGVLPDQRCAQPRP